MAREGTSKYQPLADHLATQSGDYVTMTFTQLKALLGHDLPPSAWGRRWWANSAPKRTSHAQAWLSVGWRVEEADPRYEQTVTFVRQDRAAAP